MGWGGGVSFANFFANNYSTPSYQEPLSAKQEEMKKGFLSKRIAPEVSRLKNGMTIWYIPQSPEIWLERPEWISREGEVTLTAEERQQIIMQTMSSSEFLGFKTDPMPLKDLKLKLDVAAMFSGVALVIGLINSLKLKGRVAFSTYVFIALGAFSFVLYNSDFGLLKLFLIAVGINLAIGLSLWPILSLVDKVVDIMSTNEAKV